MEAPLVSIVIVCMNRMDNLYPCLEGLRAHTSVPYECFVVAYRFSPENLAKAQTDFPWVSWVVSDELRGFSENNNLALRQARGRYCFVLNDDTEMSQDVIGALVRDFERLPQDAAIVSPRLLNADGSLQLCGRPPDEHNFRTLTCEINGNSAAERAARAGDDSHFVLAVVHETFSLAL